MASLEKAREQRQRSRTRVRLRFYEELNDFLPPHRRKTEFERDLPEPTTTKDLIEGCRVPHTEVDLILVNGEPVSFDHIIEDGDRLHPKVQALLF